MSSVALEHARLKAEVHRYERPNAWFCPSSSNPEVKAKALRLLGPAKAALATFEQKHGLNKSCTRKLTEATAVLGVIGAGIAHYTGHLTKVTSYLPSLPSFTTPRVVADAVNQIANYNVTLGLSEKIASTAKAVDAIWGLSSFIPTASTLLTVGGALATIGLVAYAAKKILRQS